MALHSEQAPILLCPDILVEIFTHLQPGRGPQEETQTRKNRRICRKTLLACFLTCRILSDLALDVLWRALDDIQPLLRLLHGESDKQQRHMRIVLKSQITPEAWTKFQSYATRVREIGHSSIPKRVHPSVWTFLGIKCEGLPLLPRLHDLKACEVSLDDLSPLFLLLSPSLRSLRLSFKDGSWSAAPRVSLLALQHITQIAPRINSFHMSGDRYITGEHVSVLQNWSRLTDLSLGSGLPLSGPMLLQLSTASSLDALTVSIHRIHLTDLQSLDNGFLSLRKLTIRGCLNHLIKFILSSHLPGLDELTLQVIDSHSVNPKGFCRRLASICQHLGLPRSLTRIGCEFCSGVAGERQDTLVRYLEPLLSFPLVEHCRFTFHHTPPSICDGDLIRLGDTWANLQSLEVRHTPRPQSPGWYHPTPGGPADLQRPTLFGLTELSRRCPSLVHVHLPELDAGTLPQTNAISRLGHSIRGILFDQVRYATPFSEKPCAIAAVLDIAFPKLDVSKSISASASASHATSRNRGMPPVRVRWEWREVMKFVHAMQLGRRHLALITDSGAATGTDFAALATGPANLDLDWDLGSEDESEPESEQDVGVGEDSEDSEADYDTDPRPDSPLAAAMFGHSDGDVSSDT
ncbi:hypothetical protein LXA43DRAFT_1025926 [Ganoderma leucocontextum]|nr:hypothetical protein LXA43DRAFT_1025926 [Ganoderma leucocontextum]